MATAKFVVNEFKKSIDDLAKLRARISKLRAQEDILEEAIKAKLTGPKAKPFVAGYEFQVELSCYDMKRLNEAKVARYLTQAQINRCYNVTPVQKMVFSKLKAAE